MKTIKPFSIKATVSTGLVVALLGTTVGCAVVGSGYDNQPVYRGDNNSQNNNFSIYTKLQWRYLPLSDLYVIFNENFNSQNFNFKNRGLIIKLTYWLSFSSVSIAFNCARQ